MSSGANNINIFEKILQKFRFRQPMSDNAKIFILRYEQKALVETLQHCSEYNFIYGLVIKIYFLSYRLKLRLSIKQSKIILSVLSAIAAGVLGAGIYYIVKFANIQEPGLPNLSDNSITIEYQSEPENIRPAGSTITNNVKEINKARVKDTARDKEYVKYRLGINLFTAKNVEQDLEKIVTDNLSKELIQIFDRKRIVDLRKNHKEVNYNRILSGSVSRLGKKILISAKVVDIESSKVIFGATKTADSVDEIDKKCADIAGMIAEEIEWD